MTDDTKEWVTIKIPKATRNEARDDPRTYGEIMEAGLAGDLAEGTTKLYQVGDGEPVDELMAKLDQIQNAQANTVSESLQLAEADGLRDQLQRIESAASTAEERTGRIEQTLEDMGARR